LRRDTLILMFVVLLVLVTAGLIPLWHTDIWGHTRYGQWILDQHEFPSQEPLSPFSDPSLSYVNHATIPSCGYSLAYQLGSRLGGDDPERQLACGANALRLLHLLIFGSSCVLLIGIVYRASQSVGVTILVILAEAYFLYPFTLIQRPQWAAVPLFLFIARVSQHREVRGWMWFALPLVFAIWANTHATWVFGLALVGTRALPLSIFSKGWAGILPNRDTRAWWRLLVLCALATLVNPHGPLILPKIMAFGSRPGVASMTEWEPLGLNPAEWVPVLLPLFILVVTIALRRQRLPESLLLFFGVLFVGACLQRRLFLWYVLLWALCMSYAVRSPNTETKKLREPRVSASGGILLAAVLVWGVCVSIFAKPEQTLFAGTPYKVALELKHPEQQGRWIPELKPVLEKGYPDHEFQGAIFASETQGDFLFWSLAPKYPVTMTTHAHLFRQEHWETCLATRDGSETGDAFLKKLNVNLIVIESLHEGLVNRIANHPDWLVLIHEPVTGTSNEIYRAKFVAIRKTCGK